MENNDEILEELKQLRAEMEQVRNPVKKQSKLKAQVQEDLLRLASNTISDLPTTIVGVVPAVIVAYHSYPNIDVNQMAMAMGIGGLGAMTNTKTKDHRKEVKESDFEELNREFG